jgi:signal transduction histidine kinase
MSIGNTQAASLWTVGQTTVALWRTRTETPRMTDVRFDVQGTKRPRNRDDEGDLISGRRRGPLVHAMWSRMMPTLLRSAIVALAIVVGSVSHDLLRALPWVIAVLILDLVAGSLLGFGPGQSTTRRNQALIVTLVGAAVAGAAIATSRGTPASLLPAGMLLLLIPAFRAGEVRGRLGAVAAVATSMVVVFGVAAGRGTLTATYLARNLQWAILALALGLLGAWTAQLAERRTQPRSPQAPAAHEAARLLRRLSDLAGALEGGFDAPAAAELLLHAVNDKIPGSRMAVLVGVGAEPAVPLALRGIDRLPWPSPTTADSVIGRVWRTGIAEAGFWTSVNEERAIAAAPLLDSEGDRIGIVVVDRLAPKPFAGADLRALADLAEGHSANVDVALIFAALRQHAAFEERERLAREMHDGIAQELVALGYRIDVARRQAATKAPAFAPTLEEARADLSRVLTDLRLRIADLRLAVRPDQGLGAVVGARLQQFGAATGLTVGLRLSESPYRLPAHLETLIYRLILDVLNDARSARGVTGIEARLDVNAPQAWLHITHDGESHLAADTFADHPLVALGATIEVQPGDSGVTVDLALNDRWPKHVPHLVSERMGLAQ